MAVRDYPGEIFEVSLALQSVIREDFIDECLMKDVSGCLIVRIQDRKGTREGNVPIWPTCARNAQRNQRPRPPPTTRLNHTKKIRSIPKSR